MKLLMLGIALSLTLVGCSNKDDGSSKNANTKQVAGDIKAGLAVAERDCKSCHGLDGAGVVPATPHLAGQRAGYMLTAIKEYKEGKRTHSAPSEMTGKLNDTDMLNVVAYYATLPPVAGKAANPAAVFLPYEHGKAKSAACAKCHSEDGNSKTPGIPSLAGQQPRYFVVALQEYLHGVRKTDPMHALLPALNKLDMESLALYFASQTPAQRPAPEGDPVAGERLSTVCSGCHGTRGLGTDAATATLAGQDPQYLIAAIKAYKKVRQHEGMRALVSNLSDKDIENIAAFYAVQKSKPAENGQGLVKELTEKCNRCHSSNVDNPSMAVPTINGQDKDYLVMSLRAYRDTRRESSMMHNMSLPYSDAIIEGIASFYANQPPTK